MAGAVLFQIDDREFQSNLRQYALVMKLDFAEAIKRQARLIAVNLAYQTQPFGETAGRQQGENKVKGDLLKIYNSASQVYAEIQKQSDAEAKKFWWLINNKKFSAAQNMLSKLGITKFTNVNVGPMDAGASHSSAKRPIPARPRIDKDQDPLLIVSNPKKISDYIKKVSMRVGIAKGGWAHCAKQLGGSRGIPQWVTRHAGKRAVGIVTDNTNANGDEQYVLMENTVPWIDKCLNGGQLQQALDMQREKMNTAIQIALSRPTRA